MAFKIIPCLAAAALAVAAPTAAFAWVQPNPYYQPNYQYQPIPVPQYQAPTINEYRQNYQYSSPYHSPNAPVWVMPPNAFGSTIR